MKCQCETFKGDGRWAPCGKPAKQVINPYVQEIYDREELIIVCPEHLQELIDDI